MVVAAARGLTCVNTSERPMVAACPDPARTQAVVYARVSSKEQEREGFSIPAQLKLLKEYAAAQGLALHRIKTGQKNRTH